MDKYFRFVNENSDKYWEIEYTQNTYNVFFGRTGSAGRTDSKEFKDVKECEKEIAKLINSKLKKGYFEVPESTRPVKEANTLKDISQFEEDWDIKVSPISKKLMNQSFFWSCVEETSPFGSDDGSDMFSFLKDAFQENPRTKPLSFLLGNFIDKSLYPLNNLNLIDEDEIISDLGDSDYEYVIRQDSSIWAVAFGQLVLRGVIDFELKEIAKNSLKRQKQNMFLELNGDEKRMIHIIEMEKVLNEI